MRDSGGSGVPDRFADVRDPAACLTPPGEPRGLRYDGGPLAVLDVISPAAWTLVFLKTHLNYDPLEEFGKHFAGDWAAYAKSGDAYRRIGDCLEDVGANIYRANERLPEVWRGNAAQQAQDYFYSLALALGRKQVELSDLEKQYAAAARTIQQTADIVGELIKSLFDKVVIAAVGAAGGTATAWTGGGAAIGYGVSAIAVTQMLGDISEITRHLHAAKLAVTAIAATIDGLIANSGDLTLSPVPESSYRHPALGEGR